MTTLQWLEANLPDQHRPVSQGGIANAKHCARFYLYRNKWGIIPKASQYSAAPKIGNLVHRMMKVGQDNVTVVHEEVMKTYNTLLDRINKGEDLEGYLAREAKEIGDLYNKALAICTIYWERFPPKDYIDTIGREMVLERTYSPPMRGIQTSSSEVPLIGIIDWLVSDDRSYTNWIRDFKTTSQSFEMKVTGLVYGLQGRFYRFLCKDKHIKGFILDMIKTPGIKLCGKDKKTADLEGITPAEAYKARVEEWYETEDEVMESRAVAFLDEPVDNKELMTHLNYACQLWLTDCDPKKFMRDITLRKCTGFRKQCPYYGLCSSAMATWPAQIEQFYQIRTDNQSAGAKEKGTKND